MIKEKNDYFKQLNFDKGLPTRNRLATLAPKQNDRKICEVMNESVGCSWNRTNVNNPTDDILWIVNNNFLNTAIKESFNTGNKEFLDENKSPSQLHEHEVNITDIDFIVNYSTNNTDRVISNTDNTSDKEILSESYLENVIQEFIHL